MRFFKKASLVFILPSLVFLSAALPFRCSVSSDSGIFKSNDSGYSWQQKATISNKENIASTDILSIAIDPLNPQIIFSGTKGSGLYQSLDGAETWQLVVDENNVLQKSDDVYDIAINQHNPNFIYLAVYSGGFGKVLRSYDGGKSWEEAYVISQSGMPVYRVVIDPANEAVIYVGTAQKGLLRSQDYGLSWQPLKWFDGAVFDIKIDARNNQTIYVSTSGKGIHKSVDQGSNWQSLVASMKSFKGSEQTGSILIDQQDSRILYVSLKDALLVSYDQGATWQKVNIVMPTGSVTIASLIQDPQNSGIIYYGAGSVLYRTTNYGQTWTTHQIPSTKKVNVIKIDPASSDIIYVGMIK
jgi:photosystem II stability/assembly factor-like uncharacterized protein